MAIPRKLNGYPVVAAAYRGAGSYYVLIKRPEAHPHPWVVATWVGGSDWCWGHYYASQADALSDWPECRFIDRKTLKPLEIAA